MEQSGLPKPLDVTYPEHGVSNGDSMQNFRMVLQCCSGKLQHSMTLATHYVVENNTWTHTDAIAGLHMYIHIIYNVQSMAIV